MNLIATIDYSNTYSSGTQVNGQVFIALFDASTGQPANGNNVTISYTVNVNGTVQNDQVIISGQSAAIYTGLISDSDPTRRFFTQFNITNVGAVPAASPPVNRCDLQISYITLDNPESAPGAADGQITVSATSSYGPIEYSIDFGVTYQLSPTFGGLTGGLVQPVAKDSNGCTAQSTLNVPVLSGLLVKDPSVMLPGGNTSRWNAAFNPIVFTYQRKDFEVTAVTLDTQTGKAILAVNASLNGLLGGDMIYLNTSIYKGQYKVMQPVTYSGSVLIDTPFAGNSAGYVNINRLRSYYQVRTQLTFTDPITGQTNIITATNRPDATGLIKADLSNFLQSLLRARDSSNFTQLNYTDKDLSAAYTVAYTEYWDGKVTSDDQLSYLSITKPYYVLYAAKQLGERYGGNLAEYIPFLTVADSGQLAHWITDFSQPAYTNGYPFDIGYIYNEDLNGQQLYCEMIPMNINRNPLASPVAGALLSDDGSSLLNEDGSTLLAIGADALAIPLAPQPGLNRLMINTVFDPDVYYFTLTLKYDDSQGTHSITQTQVIRVDDAVDERSVYLRWIGLTGSWNYYRFVYNQDVTLDVQNAVIIKNYVYDWENQDSIEEVIGKSAGQKMKVMAEDLSIADIKGLQSIKYSPKVQMLVNRNPVKWQTIVINTATYSEYETMNGQGPFSITFNMPSINIQSQ